MVCIAAFIILALIGGFVAGISIFRPSIGKAYLRTLKKAWGCLWKRVRLQKCETGFKDDVKNTLLSRVVVKRPELVKPLSILIEISSIVIVVVTVWALITSIKSLLALWVLGTCNITKPSACTLGSEICSVDEEQPSGVIDSTIRWFTEWGEIFEAMPDKFRTYDASSYDFAYITVNPDVSDDAPIAIDIIDPGCSACLKSYVNQKKAGFFDAYNVRLVPFPIQGADGVFKFKNSELITRYMFAAEQTQAGLAVKIIEHIFMDKDADGTKYQTLFNNVYSEEEAKEMLDAWLRDAGLDNDAIAELKVIAGYPEISDKITSNQTLGAKLHIRGIPTMIYDGKKHTGLWESD